MQLNFLNKTALVCGSTQGIGFAIANKLAECGATLILVARDEIKLQKAVEDLNNPSLHTYITADFTKQGDIDVLCEKIKSYKIDILINNTGGPAAGPISNAKPEDFIAAFNMHLISNHKITQAVLPSMKENKFGRIINIISTSVKQPLPNLGVSNTIRAAVANWAKTLSNEVASFGITVNNVLPGATSTQRLENIISNKASKLGASEDSISNEMMNEIPMKRFGKPEEIAHAVVFLSSEYASYITGINVPVDGGRTSSL
jgi:3-oxoacyl-[acyl-carrier protein] reductase